MHVHINKNKIKNMAVLCNVYVDFVLTHRMRIGQIGRWGKSDWLADLLTPAHTHSPCTHTHRVDLLNNTDPTGYRDTVLLAPTLSYSDPDVTIHHATVDFNAVLTQSNCIPYRTVSSVLFCWWLAGWLTDWSIFSYCCPASHWVKERHTHKNVPGWWEINAVYILSV